MNYEKPEVMRFGSFRELTQVGASGSNDVLSVAGAVSGCQTGSEGDCVRAS